ncbi:unnamed protein product [Prorocentrum cordatum]|uniref:Uncharacterized protein n=1 Tax=Prorocentrum cordatum TaxID=2364126 RepID=A0ABN9V9H4_9DINO|nr:unnamed protein product [Polarella glacialis]
MCFTVIALILDSDGRELGAVQLACSACVWARCPHTPRSSSSVLWQHVSMLSSPWAANAASQRARPLLRSTSWRRRPRLAAGGGQATRTRSSSILGEDDDDEL